MYQETVKQLLETWDDGGIIWSIELGGMGPGYEQAIQVAAVEMARDGQDMKLSGDDEADSKAWEEVCSASLKKHDEALCGLSGAQYGAARWLAYQWVFTGPAAVVQRAKDQGKQDDLIMVSKHFPRAS